GVGLTMNNGIAVTRGVGVAVTTGARVAVGDGAVVATGAGGGLSRRSAGSGATLPSAATVATGAATDAAWWRAAGRSPPAEPTVSVYAAMNPSATAPTSTDGRSRISGQRPVTRPGIAPVSRRRGTDTGPCGAEPRRAGS